MIEFYHASCLWKGQLHQILDHGFLSVLYQLTSKKLEVAVEWSLGFSCLSGVADSRGFLAGEWSELAIILWCLPLSPADPVDKRGCEEEVGLCGVLCLDLLLGRPVLDLLDWDRAGLVCVRPALLVTAVSRGGRLELLLEEREFV